MKLAGWKRATLVACCLVLLFVLLCPYTPSPTPLAKVKAVLMMASVCLLLPLSQLLARVASAATQEAPRSAAVPLITLNCSLLC